VVQTDCYRAVACQVAAWWRSATSSTRGRECSRPLGFLMPPSARIRQAPLPVGSRPARRPPAPATCLPWRAIRKTAVSRACTAWRAAGEHFVMLKARGYKDGVDVPCVMSRRTTKVKAVMERTPDAH